MVSDIKAFIKGYKATITSTGRTWERQLYHILRPRNKGNYKNIKKRFKDEFKLKELPADKTKLTDKQRKWWKTEIMKQAGIPGGFSHVGGNAVDVNVAELTMREKEKLKAEVEKEGIYKVYPEYVVRGKSKYGVKVEEANVFHIYKTGKGKKTLKKEKKRIIDDRMDHFFFKKRNTGIWV